MMARWSSKCENGFSKNLQSKSKTSTQDSLICSTMWTINWVKPNICD
jgi:hypothetical protein